MKETNEYFMFLSTPQCDPSETHGYATICQMGVPHAVSQNPSIPGLSFHATADLTLFTHPSQLAERYFGGMKQRWHHVSLPGAHLCKII
jgi:hypothetical protein